MKLFKKTLILVGTLVTFITLFTFFSVNTHALPPDYEPDLENGYPTMYYFNDYYPEVDHCTMAALYPEYHVCYDHQRIDSQAFDTLVGSGYFYGFDAGSVVIIDIKTFKPDEDTLEDLFYYLKNSYSCTTVFVSTYNQTDFTSTTVFQNLDLFVRSYHSEIDEAILDILSEIFSGGDFSNKAIFLDELTIDISTLTINGTYAHSLLNNSPFISRLLSHISTMILNQSNVSVIGYSVLEYLHLNNTHIFVHDGNGGYFDLYSGTSYEATDPSVIQGAIGCNWTNTYAIGFWSLDPDFYDFLLDAQDMGNCTVYVFECEHIESGEDGLVVTVVPLRNDVFLTMLAEEE